MSFDMSQFYQVFFEEAAEHLASMESLLLEVDRDNPDGEQLNAIFRAAHSIKGSAGTFGFKDMAEVTHVLETLLDRIRKGEIALTEDMVDAFLEAGDVLKDLLAAHRGEGASDPDAVGAVCEKLKRLSDSATFAVAAPAQPELAGALAGSTTGAAQCFDVRFAVDAPPASAAGIVENLLAEMRRLGEVVVAARPSVHSAQELWQLSLVTDADMEAVRGLLEFVAIAESIVVTPRDHAGAEVAAGTAGAGAPPDDAYGFFEPEPEDQSAAGVPEEAYGLFEHNTAQGGGGEARAIAGAGESGDDTAKGYGFFEPVTAHPAQPTEVAAIAVGPIAAVSLRQAKDTAGQRAAKDGKAAPKPAGDAASIRVSVEKVDQLINLVGELVITQAMLNQAATAVDPVVFERLMDGLAQLERNTRDLQESVMSIRMLPISVVFSRFPRVVRDLSQKLGKHVELKLSGENTELDKGLIERITDPLTHLVRNSLDHGIESPEARAAAGKPPVGTITLKAYHQSGNIVIEVGDDGAGLNRTKILAKARERGLTVSDAMSDQEVWQLIFEAGFSTAEALTEVSGRGVGMDVVKKNITAMGGRVDIESVTGVGTRMTVRLPLTLAILDGMSVAVGNETYLIPLNYVVESLQPTRAMIKSVCGVRRLIQVRGEYLPVVALHELFNVPGHAADFERGIMVVLEADGVKAAMFVDALVGQHQVVIKSIEANYRKVAGISGATIMGDGRVAMILDVIALVAMTRGALAAAA
jgi:two-component system chemotaxis sensor kinase CheA